MWELDCEESWARKNWCFWTVCWRRLLRVPWTARRSKQAIQMRSVLGVQWKDWRWSWNSNTLATSYEELTHWKRPWCWQGLGAGGEEDDRGWDGWMASLTRWTWVWVNSGIWTGRPGVLRFMGLQRVGHDWATELNWSANLGFPRGAVVKNPTANAEAAGDVGGFDPWVKLPWSRN